VRLMRPNLDHQPDKLKSKSKTINFLYKVKPIYDARSNRV